MRELRDLARSASWSFAMRSHSRRYPIGQFKPSCFDCLSKTTMSDPRLAAHMTRSDFRDRRLRCLTFCLFVVSRSRVCP